MTTISVYLPPRTARGEWHDVETEIRYSKRQSGGWLVKTADGHELGWLYKMGDLWEARVSAAAFRGDGKDDPGYILDDVPEYLTNGGITSTRAIGYGRTREEAVEEMLSWLHRHDAPALGYGRHPAVRRWADR